MKTLKQIEEQLKRNIEYGIMTSKQAAAFMKAAVEMHTAEIKNSGFKGFYLEWW